MFTALLELFIFVNFASFIVTFALESIDHANQEDKPNKKPITFNEITKYITNIAKCIDFGNKILDVTLRVIVMNIVLLIAPGVLIGSKLANMLFHDNKTT